MSKELSKEQKTAIAEVTKTMVGQIRNFCAGNQIDPDAGEQLLTVTVDAVTQGWSDTAYHRQVEDRIYETYFGATDESYKQYSRLVQHIEVIRKGHSDRLRQILQPSV